MSDKPKNLSDIDNFWDLNNLLPQKRPVAPFHRAVNTDTVELELGSNASPSSPTAAIPPRQSPLPADTKAPHTTSTRDEARRLNEISMRTRAQQNAPRVLEPYLIYEPNSRLIRRVAVSKWQTRYNFYEKFREDAKRLWDRTPSQCDHVPFFSYIPQYNQLKYAQLKWYLKWRDSVRHGEYPHTDFSYILLFIFEIINCPDLIKPQNGLEMLCDIWLHYRKEHRRIDNYLCEWVCDFCLINKLPCPTHRLEPILNEIVAICDFKEFYMDIGENQSAAANILAYCSTYDWHSSRYVTGENINIFAHHIRAAFDKAYREVLAYKFDEIEAKEVHLTRDAYNGALCVYDMKRSLTIDYISYARSPKLRFVVTDIIKYSENRVRMALGIKARLKVEELSDTLKACIDEYFNINLPAPSKNRASSSKDTFNEREYDKFYEPTSKEFSVDNARRIEEASWSTTDILTAALTDESDHEESTPITPSLAESTVAIPTIAAIPANDSSEHSPDSDEFAEFVSSLDDISKRALRELSGGDGDAIAKAAATMGIFADALADMINEKAFDIIGDTVIESDGTSYRLINEYEGELTKWLK